MNAALWARSECFTYCLVRFSPSHATLGHPFPTCPTGQHPQGHSKISLCPQNKRNSELFSVVRSHQPKSCSAVIDTYWNRLSRVHHGLMPSISDRWLHDSWKM